MSDELSKTSVSELTDTIDRYSGGDPDAVAAGAELADRLAAVEADRDHWKARAEAAEGVVASIPWDAVDSLPKDWCVGCFNAILRYQRKNSIECGDCYDSDEYRGCLDDYNEPALTAIIKWAQSALAARQPEHDAGGEVGNG